LQTSLSAFEELYRTHGDRMKSLAYNLLGNVSDAEDAVHDAFVKACRGREQFRGGASLWTWLCRILINTCYDMGRQRTSRRVDAIADLPEAELRAAPDSDHPLRISLERIVADLPDRQREVFLLYAVEGCTHVEIAEMLGIAEGTSKAALFEARRHIREALKRQPIADRGAR